MVRCNLFGPECDWVCRNNWLGLVWFLVYFLFGFYLLVFPFSLSKPTRRGGDEVVSWLINISIYAITGRFLVAVSRFDRPTYGLWAHPVLLRKGGTRAGLTNSWRIVCDFRQLNAKSQKLTWTPPNVREILDDLQGHKYFSKTDAVGGLNFTATRVG